MKTFQERLDRWMGPAFQRPADPARVPPGVSRREVQARKALRWYAPSWREAHGEELVTTVLDASAPTSGGVDDGLKWSTRVELACSGLQQRHRYRPSWQVRSRLLHGTPPASWDELGWLRDTLDQRGQLLRLWDYSSLLLGVVRIESCPFGTGFLRESRRGWRIGCVGRVEPAVHSPGELLHGSRRWQRAARTERFEEHGSVLWGWPLSWNRRHRQPRRLLRHVLRRRSDGSWANFAWPSWSVCSAAWLQSPPRTTSWWADRCPSPMAQ